VSKPVPSLSTPWRQNRRTLTSRGAAALGLRLRSTIAVGLLLSALPASAQSVAPAVTTNPSKPAQTTPAVSTPSSAAPSASAPPTVAPPAVAPSTPPPPATSVEQLAKTRALGGQAALALGRRGSTLLATLCQGKVCDWERATDMGAPAEVVAALNAEGVGELKLAPTRRALSVWVTVGERTWRAVVGAPVTSGKDTASAQPVVAFAGYTGFVINDEGERVGRDVHLFPKERGLTDVVVGDLSADVQLCGRSTLLSPKVLYASEMRLRGIKFQRLAQAERDGATHLAAVVNPAPVRHHVLRARGASSAVGSPAALTDGDRKTSWAEKRGGDGSGEFAVLAAPPSVPISGLNFQLRPSVSDGHLLAEGAVAPSALWLALDQGLFHVTLPEGAWSAEHEGEPATFSVVFPSPVKTSCIGVVVDGAQVPKEQASSDLDVTIAEISAHATVTAEEIAAAATALGGADATATAARDLLVAFGTEGQRAVAEQFGKLKEVGRLRALSILDDAPCELAAPAYARSLDGTGSELHEHGARGLQRCGQTAQPAVLRLFRRAKGERLSALGSVLLEQDAVVLFDVAVARLNQAPAGLRKRLRDLIGAALKQPAALQRTKEVLANSKLGEIAALDVLRAAGSEIAQLQPAAGTVALGLLSGKPTLRTRYLVLEPLAQLAATDKDAEAALVRLLTGDESRFVRARAAQLAPRRGKVTAALVRAADDDAVRVREAAIDRLADYRVVSGTDVFIRRVEGDPWPLVRAASVRALRELPPSERVSRVLADTAELDLSAEVRRPAVLALGTLDAQQHLEVVRAVYEDDEDPYVAAAAAAALGQLCDRGSLEVLTASARKLAVLGNSERDTILARASLSALGRLNPPDLEQRLAVFYGPDVNVLARGAADQAKHHPEPCSR